VQIEVSGLCQQAVMNRSTYTVKVPYSSMSQTMRSISRLGGTIVGVTTTPGLIAPRASGAEGVSKVIPEAIPEVISKVSPEAKPAAKKGKKK
jgi:archaeosine-15-forming tRNA-guanine transglycosylase